MWEFKSTFVSIEFKNINTGSWSAGRTHVLNYLSPPVPSAPASSEPEYGLSLRLRLRHRGEGNHQGQSHQEGQRQPPQKWKIHDVVLRMNSVGGIRPRWLFIPETRVADLSFF